MIDLSHCCAPGTAIEDRMVRISDAATLRVMTFTPTIDRGYPVVLFVAGWITQIGAWQEVLRELTLDHTVVYAETREKHSAVMASGADYSIPGIAGDVVALVSALGFSPGGYVLFGSSLGATVIVESLHALPVRPAAIALVAPNAVFRVPRTWKVIATLFYPPLYLLIRPLIKWHLRTFRLDVESDPAQYEKYCAALDAADPWKLKRAVLAVARYEIWDRLPAIDCPTLLIGAFKDVLHEPKHLETMASMIPHARLVDLETNSQTHSAAAALEFRKFMKSLGHAASKVTPL